MTTLLTARERIAEVSEISEIGKVSRLHFENGRRRRTDMLKVEKLRVSVGGVEVLNGVNLIIGDEETHVLL